MVESPWCPCSLRCNAARMSRAGSYFSRRRGLAEFISAGPLASVLEELTRRLEEKGYCPSTIQGYVRAARHVTYSIERRQLARRDRTLPGLRRFARTHCASCRCPHRETAASANFYSCTPHLLPILIRAGLAPEPRRTPFADELAAYDKYMAEVKGLSEETRAIQRRALAPVLRALMPRGRFDPARMTGVALQSHVSTLAGTRSPHTVHRTVVAIRDFLRFLQTRGIDTTKALAMLKGPKVVSPLSSRKALTMPQMRALLAPLMCREPLAMRDLAIVLLLGQVGLRRADVTRLTIHDFNGRAGILRVQRSKSRRAFELPVPDETREAILRYVRHGRPSVATPALFVAHAFPYDAGITTSAVSGLVARAFRRSGIEHLSNGAHVLRHTLATHLVAAKQPLKAIADVMPHRAIDTTVRYTRVDLDRLRAAVCPWPEETTDVQPGTT